MNTLSAAGINTVRIPVRVSFSSLLSRVLMFTFPSAWVLACRVAGRSFHRILSKRWPVLSCSSASHISTLSLAQPYDRNKASDVSKRLELLSFSTIMGCLACKAQVRCLPEGKLAFELTHSVILTSRFEMHHRYPILRTHSFFLLKFRFY